MTHSKTILGHHLSDYSLLVFPGLIGIIVYSILGDNPALALFTSLFLDSGHVYTTFWKLNIKEVLKNSKVIIGFLVIVIGFSSWIFFELPFLWSFVTYTTLYHHVRQCYGMGRWLDPKGLKIDKFFQYLLFFSFLCFHFRNDVSQITYYDESDFFIFPHMIIFSYLKVLFLCLSFLWLGLCIKEKVSMKKVIYGVCTLITFAYCFLFATSITMLIVPLVFLHTSTYLSLMIDFNHQQRGFSFIHSIFFVLFTALICGAIDFKFEYFALDQDINWLKSFASLFVVTPLFMHFYLDALIWKGQIKFQRF